VQPTDPGPGEPDVAPVAWGQPADAGPGRPDVAPAGSVQAIDAGVGESVGRVDASATRPVLEGPIPDDKTNPDSGEGAGDKTNPAPTAPAPAPAIAASPMAAAGVPSLEEYVAMATARLERYGPLPPAIREAARDFQERWRS
jgi:hypothetical protein